MLNSIRWYAYATFCVLVMVIAGCGVAPSASLEQHGDRGPAFWRHGVGCQWCAPRVCRVSSVGGLLHEGRLTRMDGTATLDQRHVACE